MTTQLLQPATLEKESQPVLVSAAEALELQALLDLPGPSDTPSIVEDIDTGEEKYGLSLSAMRAVGRLALSGAEVRGSAEAEQLKGEFNSCVFEGLSSDKELGRQLQVTKFDNLDVADGRAVSASGTPVAELVNNGCESSKKEARTDEKMWTQVRRDENDLRLVEKVDSMVAGNEDFSTIIAISSDPKEAIRRDGPDYWYKRGYVEDMVYIQLYHSSGDQLFTGALSFKAKDLDKLKKALMDRGVDVPEDVNADDLINHHWTFNAADPEEAKDKSLRLREECADSLTVAILDTVEVVENQASMDVTFDEMYLPITKSLASGKKTDRIAEIVSVFKANSQYFADEVKDQLAAMEYSEHFTDEDARLLHKLSVYAAIERMRTELKSDDSGRLHMSTDAGVEFFYEAATGGDTDVRGFIASMGGFVQIGSSAGRDYSSCGAALKLASQEVKEFDFGWGTNMPQDIFGGHLKKEEEDRFGPLIFACTEGHTNKRKPGEMLLKCQTRPCKGKVAC